jgi:hypothetical protein
LASSVNKNKGNIMAVPVGMSPVWLQTNFTDVDGLPLSGGKIWSFASNSDETLPTYADAAGTIMNANPIVLDSAGRMPVPMYIEGGLLYRYMLTDANDQYITEINNVAVPMLVAGTNISLDPPSGIGPQVTINALGPASAADYGQGPTYMWAGVANAPGVPLDGTSFGNFTTTLKVPTTAPTTPETEIIDNVIWCYTPGSYSVVFTVKLYTTLNDGGAPIAWPFGQTVFGTRFASGDNFMDEGMHTRYCDVEYDNIGSAYEVVTFTDTYTFSNSGTSFTKPFYLYAINSWNQAFTPLLASFEVAITRFGEPYDATWPIPN